MRLIALESSAEWCSAALWRDGEIAVIERRADHRHGELLLPMVERLLAQAELGAHALDGVAFGAGPGSFTGLRIACGIAQGLALAHDLPVVGIPSLEALAERAQGADRTDGARGARVIACLDARMHEVYCAAFERSGEAWRAVVEAQCVKPGDIDLPPGEGWTGAGGGFAVHGDALRARLGAALAQVMPDLWPGAQAVVRLAAARFGRGEGVDAGLAQPHYVREKVALTSAERLGR